MDLTYVTDTSKVFHKWEKNELQDFKPIKQYINIGAQPILTFLTVIFHSCQLFLQPRQIEDRRKIMD